MGYLYHARLQRHTGFKPLSRTPVPLSQQAENKSKATSGGQAQKAETVALRLDTSVPDSGVHLSRNVAMVLSGSKAGDRRDTPRFAVAFALVRGSRHHPPTAVDN